MIEHPVLGSYFLRKFGYLARLAAPTLVVGSLILYADVVDGTGRIPFHISIIVALLMGFLLPKGSWRWVILIGIGVDLAHLTGNLIDATAIPNKFPITGKGLLFSLIPALTGTYSGIFFRRFFSGSEETAAQRLEAELETMHRRISEAKEAHSGVKNDENQEFEEVEAASLNDETVPSSLSPVEVPETKELIQPVEPTADLPAVVSSRRIEALQRLESKLGLK